MAFGFQICLSKKAVGFKMFGESLQDMLAMRNGFVQMSTVDHCLDLSVICPK
jgi:hypothetical protein